MPVYETKKVTAAVSTKNRGARRSGHANEDSTTDHRQYQELKYAVNQAVLQNKMATSNNSKQNTTTNMDQKTSTNQTLEVSASVRDELNKADSARLHQA